MVTDATRGFVARLLLSLCSLPNDDCDWSRSSPSRVVVPLGRVDKLAEDLSFSLADDIAGLGNDLPELSLRTKLLPGLQQRDVESRASVEEATG